MTTICSVVEIWPREFGSAADAVAWADDFLAFKGDRNQSQLGADIRKRNRKNTPPSVDSAGELVTGSRLQDLAETITTALSGVQNPPGVFYRYIYGRYTYTLGLSDILAHHVYDGGIPIATMRDLALLAIADRKKKIRYGEFISDSAMASYMKVGRKEFKTIFRPYLTSMREVMKVWLEMAERDLVESLSACGVL